MAQAQWLFLLHRNRVNELISALNLGNLLVLAAGFKGVYQFWESFEVAHDFLLIGRGNHRKAAGAYRGRLLCDEFNAGSINNGKQFFGNRLGGGQKSGAHTCRWNYNRGDSAGGIFAFYSHA